ncbi:unnamed protein product [Lampetra planeri]
METRRKIRTRALDEEADETTAPGLTTPAEGDKLLPAELQSARPPGRSPPSGRVLRAVHSCLAELLHAVVSILDEIHHWEPTAEEGGAGLQATAITATGSEIPTQDFETPLKLGEFPPKAKGIMGHMQHPEFSVAGGDWAAFQRRFISHRMMAGWTEERALRALLAAFDDDAIAAVITIPRADRTTLQQALQRMAEIYGPPSET